MLVYSLKHIFEFIKYNKLIDVIASMHELQTFKDIMQKTYCANQKSLFEFPGSFFLFKTVVVHPSCVVVAVSVPGPYGLRPYGVDRPPLSWVD